MKKLLLLSAFVSAAFFAKAQSTSYHAFKVDVGLGYASPIDGSGTKAGVVFTVEPHYRVTDDISVGLRFEGAGLGYANSETDDAKVSLLTSYCATGEYYFMKEGFRPFAGVGAGLFTRSVVASSGDESISASASKFGFFPRVGFEAGHFRLAAAYDILSEKAGYFGITVGAFFGGGKK